MSYTLLIHSPPGGDYEIYRTVPDQIKYPILPRELADAVAEHIHKNFNQELSLPEIARLHYTTVPTMQRAFQKWYALSVYRYIIYTRIYEVKRLLLETADDLESISLLTQFSDAQHLCRVFKKVTGKTPAQFRRRSVCNN